MREQAIEAMCMSCPQGRGDAHCQPCETEQDIRSVGSVPRPPTHKITAIEDGPPGRRKITMESPDGVHTVTVPTESAVDNLIKKYGKGDEHVEDTK